MSRASFLATVGVALIMLIIGVAIGSVVFPATKTETVTELSTTLQPSTVTTSIVGSPMTTTVLRTTAILTTVLATSITTSTQYQTSILSNNTSLSELMVSNVDVGGFPNSIGINPRTDVLYVSTYAATGLSVINGSTNSLIISIPVGAMGTPIVNPNTNTVYVGNAIINGTTNKVSAYINQSMTFVAVNPSLNVVYAMNSTWNRFNGTTTIFEINGTTNKIVSSLSFFGDPSAGENPIAMNEQRGILYILVCTTACGFVDRYVVGIGTTSSGLQIVSQISLNKLALNIAVNPKTNMIYVTALQNLFIVINGTSNQIIGEIPITAYANELRGIALDPSSNEIFLSGAPLCHVVGFPECDTNTLYVLSAINYGIFATFVDSNPFTLQFDPANSQTYVLYYFSHFVASVKIPHYNVTIVLP